MRWLLPALVGACAALWIDALAGGGLVAGLPAVIVVAALSLVGGLRSGLLPLALAGLASVALLSVADQVVESGKFTLASDGVFYCVVVLAPALLGWLIGSRSRQVTDLEARRRALEARRIVALDVARVQERERVQRRVDLSLSDKLGEIAAAARLAQELAGLAPARVPMCLDAIETVARDALGELRELLGGLHRVPSAENAERAENAENADDVREPGGNVSTPARPGDRIDLLLVLAVVPLAIETAAPGHHGPAALNVLVSLAQGGALLLQRRRPLPGVTVLIAIACVQTSLLAALPSTVSWLLPGLLSAFLLGLSVRLPESIAGLAGLVAGVGAITFATPSAHRSMASLVPGLVMGVLAWLGGRVAMARAARADELRAIADELDRTRHAEARLAAAGQRAELARDLHDVGAHALTVVCLQAGAASAWWERDRRQAEVAVDSIRTIADDTLAQLGRSLTALGDDADQGAAKRLDPVALEALVGIGQVLGLSVDIGVDGPARVVADDIARVAHRVMQEALTNAARHAAGSSVHICLAYLADSLEVRITDSGADPAGEPVLTVSGSGAGLRGMRERVQALRGELFAGPADPGFQIVARLPA